jgi:hypothetical protein
MRAMSFTGWAQEGVQEVMLCQLSEPCKHVQAIERSLSWCNCSMNPKTASPVYEEHQHCWLSEVRSQVGKRSPEVPSKPMKTRPTCLQISMTSHHTLTTSKQAILHEIQACISTHQAMTSHPTSLQHAQPPSLASNIGYG